MIKEPGNTMFGDEMVLTGVAYSRDIIIIIIQ